MLHIPPRKGISASCTRYINEPTPLGSSRFQKERMSSKARYRMVKFSY
jgi:hypothetical protein